MFKIEQAHLESMILSASRIAGDDRSPTLACARLAYDGTALTVEATDGPTRITMHWPNVIGDQPWSALVNARKLLSHVRVMPGGKPVRLAIDGTRLRLASGEREREISTHADDAYPPAPPAPPLDGALEIPAGVLLRLIEATSWAVPRAIVDPNRFWMTGIRLTWNPSRVVAFATDGGTNNVSMEVSGAGETSGDIILSARAAKAIGVVGKEDDEVVALRLNHSTAVRLCGNERHVRLDAGGARILALNLGEPGTLPPPNLDGPEVHLPRAALLDALKSMRSFRTARLRLDGERVLLSADMGAERASDVIPCAGGSRGFAVALTPDKIIESAAHWDHDFVSFVVDPMSVTVCPWPHDGKATWLRYARYHGDVTPGVVTAGGDGPCALCLGKPLHARPGAGGTKSTVYSPSRAATLEIREIVGAKREKSDIEIKCPACADAPVPTDAAILRYAK